MPTTYTETPDNFNEIGTFVEKEINGIKKIFYLAQRVIFYDACSFQRHSHLPDKEIKVLMNYKEILYLIFDYPHKHYTFKHFEI